jgi:hypothetical protein
MQAIPSFSSIINNDNLLFSGTEDDQSIAESVQCLHGIGDLWDPATEQDLMLCFGGNLAILVPHGLDCVDLSERQLVTLYGFTGLLTYSGAFEPDKVLLDLCLRGLYGVYEDSDPVAMSRQVVGLQLGCFVVELLVFLTRNLLLDSLEGACVENVTLELDLSRVLDTRVMCVLSGWCFGIRHIDIGVLLVSDIAFDGAFCRFVLFGTVIGILVLSGFIFNRMLFNTFILHVVVFVDIVVDGIARDLGRTDSEIFVLLYAVNGRRDLSFGSGVGHVDIVLLVDRSRLDVARSAA